ncbi:50S ribosomal protein L9 [Candidatus Dependentiae bacterium]|nr:50S ribosomal protein L9 [Candidatus Dependentiae bacterium]
MKVYLLKDIEKVGIAGEIITVSDGYAKNFLLPRKLGLEVTGSNADFFQKRAKTIEHRKEVIESVTSMLSEQIKNLSFTIKKKLHDNNKLYASINPADIVDLLATKNIKISKSQVIFDKSIKEAGTYPITIKLSSKLQPQMTLKVVGLTEK